MISVAIIRMDNRGKPEYAVLLNADKSICGFHNAVDAVRNFEQKYNASHRLSYEGSMSALINWVFFRPAIIEVDGIEDIKKLLEDPENITMASFSHISGAFTGLVLDPEKAASAWERGIKPSLIA